ncbi:unnamed protein product, partial [Polarella glacialis]
LSLLEAGAPSQGAEAGSKALSPTSPGFNRALISGGSVAGGGSWASFASHSDASEVPTSLQTLSPAEEAEPVALATEGSQNALALPSEVVGGGRMSLFSITRGLRSRGSSPSAATQKTPLPPLHEVSDTSSVVDSGGSRLSTAVAVGGQLPVVLESPVHSEAVGSPGVEKSGGDMQFPAFPSLAQEPGTADPSTEEESTPLDLPGRLSRAEASFLSVADTFQSQDVGDDGPQVFDEDPPTEEYTPADGGATLDSQDTGASFVSAARDDA